LGKFPCAIHSVGLANAGHLPELSDRFDEIADSLEIRPELAIRKVQQQADQRDDYNVFQLSCCEEPRRGL
jgi:hypothetical protein